MAKVRHGKVYITLDVPNDTFLEYWANAPFMPLPGCVVFFQTKGSAARETLSWEEGHCVGYREEFEEGSSTTGSYVCHVVIAAPKLTMSPGGPPQPFVAPAPREHGSPVAATLLSAAAAGPNMIKLNGGAKGGWNKTLNEDLLSDTIYEVDDIHYQTDSLGRVATTTISHLKISPRDRNAYQQGKAVASKDGVSGDQGGHIIAARLGGPGEQINYHPMKGTLNQGAWKKMENDWAKAINERKTVDVEIKSVFQGDSKRPAAFVVNTRTDGIKTSKTFVN